MSFNLTTDIKTKSQHKFSLQFHTLHSQIHFNIVIRTYALNNQVGSAQETEQQITRKTGQKQLSMTLSELVPHTFSSD